LFQKMKFRYIIYYVMNNYCCQKEPPKNTYVGVIFSRAPTYLNFLNTHLCVSDNHPS
jgi:hypothetical protein